MIGTGGWGMGVQLKCREKARGNFYSGWWVSMKIGSESELPIFGYLFDFWGTV
jgi:hypothetical protein